MTTTFPPDTVRACCVAGETDTTYSRAGRGEPVVVLTADRETSARLLALLPRHFHAIAPDARVQRDFSGWMRGFLDALGLPAVSLIVDSAFAPDVVYFALHEPERVNRITFLAANGQALLGAWGEPVEFEGQAENMEEIAAHFA